MSRNAAVVRLAGVAQEHPDCFVIRRARKTHTCAKRYRWNPRTGESTLVGRKWDSGPVPAECCGHILAGEQYVEDLTTAPPFQAGPRYCAHCAVAAGLAAMVAPEQKLVVHEPESADTWDYPGCEADDAAEDFADDAEGFEPRPVPDWTWAEILNEAPEGEAAPKCLQEATSREQSVVRLPFAAARAAR